MQWKLALFLGLTAGALAMPAQARAQQAKAPATEAKENPFVGKPEAVAEGKKLYTKWGCAGCHGTEAEGGMAPSLIDSQWMYGQTDADVFQSIHGGRPKGMPAWGKKLDEDEIWKVIAYLRSLYTGTQK